jgi:hypothetical protein
LLSGILSFNTQSINPSINHLDGFLSFEIVPIAVGEEVSHARARMISCATQAAVVDISMSGELLKNNGWFNKKTFSLLIDSAI